MDRFRANLDRWGAVAAPTGFLLTVWGLATDAADYGVVVIGLIVMVLGMVGLLWLVHTQDRRLATLTTPTLGVRVDNIACRTIDCARPHTASLSDDFIIGLIEEGWIPSANHVHQCSVECAVVYVDNLSATDEAQGVRAEIRRVVDEVEHVTPIALHWHEEGRTVDIGPLGHRPLVIGELWSPPWDMGFSDSERPMLAPPLRRLLSWSATIVVELVVWQKAQGAPTTAFLRLERSDDGLDIRVAPMP